MHNQEIRRIERFRQGAANLMLDSTLMIRFISLLGSLLVPSSVQNLVFRNATPLLAPMMPVITLGVLLFTVFIVTIFHTTVEAFTLIKLKADLQQHATNNLAAQQIIEIELAKSLQARNAAIVARNQVLLATLTSCGVLYIHARGQRDLDPTASAIVAAAGFSCTDMVSHSFSYAYRLWQTRYRADNNAVAPGAANQVGVAMPNPVAG